MRDREKMLNLPGVPEKSAQGDLFSGPEERTADIGEDAAEAQTGVCLYLSLYMLDRADCSRLKLTDAYSAHRIIYNMFPLEKKGRKQRDFLFADTGVKNRKRQFVILSQTEPEQPQTGELNTIILPPDYLEAETYKFKIVINPVIKRANTGQNESIRDAEAICEWFMRKAPGWGFEVIPETLQVNSIDAKQFVKNGNAITLNMASLSGWLRVNNKMLFAQSIRDGLGRGKAFGCGLLQIAPANLRECAD